MEVRQGVVAERERAPASYLAGGEGAIINDEHKGFIITLMDLSSIPHTPGVYLMRDRSGNILYVG